MTKPTQEWLEKWTNETEATTSYEELEKVLTAIYSEVYAKARRETLEEVYGIWNSDDPFDEWICEQTGREDPFKMEARRRRARILKEMDRWFGFDVERATPQECQDSLVCFRRWLAEQLKEADGERT